MLVSYKKESGNKEFLTLVTTQHLQDICTSECPFGAEILQI